MPVRPALLRLLAAVATATVLGAGLPAAVADPLPVDPSDTANESPTDDGATGDDTGDDTGDGTGQVDTPLTVSIDSLTPGVLPRTGPLVVGGTVTNVDLETWRDVRLYPLFGAGPNCTLCGEVMTTPADLALAADADPEAPVGERYTSDEAVRASVPVLEPGESATFTIRIPQRVLRELFATPAAGVYWFGVHALGASDGTPRDEVSDGRARTFLPYLPPRITKDPARAVPTAVVVPLRARVEHTDEGAIADTEEWLGALGQDGELGGPLAFGVAAGSTPFTWLVDPAVPDAVRALARGNPERSIVTVTPPPGETPSEEPSGSAEPTDGASDDATDGDGDDGTDGDDAAGDPDDPLVAAARSWLDVLEPELTGDEVAVLPYGDPDLAALGDVEPNLYTAAREHPGEVLTDWEVEGEPVAGAPDGYLDSAGMLAVDDDATLLVGDRLFPTETFSATGPVDGLVGERPVVVTSTEAATGGPAPGPQLAATALRQRILSEAVVRAIEARDGSVSPLVVVLPQDLVATGAIDFWSGLSVDGVRMVELSDVATAGSGDPSDAARQIDPTLVSYPDSAEEAELPAALIAEASRLTRTAASLQDVLGEDVRIRGTLVGEALTGMSYAQRGDDGAEERLAEARRWAERQLRAITIDAPAGVTLSGESGSFNVAVSNDLDHPVTVRIEATADGGADVEVGEPITLAPHSRGSVPVQATTSRTGVHNVTLRLTDSAGNTLGGQDSLPLRTGQVGVVIWAIMGTGLAILFVAIGVRLVRRVRRHRARVQGAPEATA